ncbi:MAG: hypothetical protein V1696_04085 [Candidatus Jorgensenbacteria bacterium]
MSLTHNEQLVTDQLLVAIKDMRDFLLDLENTNAINFNDEKIYEEHYTRIRKLSIKVCAEGYEGYKHKNPHKTLGKFFRSGRIDDLVLKFYSEPVFKKDIIKKPAVLKVIDGTIKRGGKIAEIFGKMLKFF